MCPMSPMHRVVAAQSRTVASPRGRKSSNNALPHCMLLSPWRPYLLHTKRTPRRKTKKLLPSLTPPHATVEVGPLRIYLPHILLSLHKIVTRLPELLLYTRKRLRGREKRRQNPAKQPENHLYLHPLQASAAPVCAERTQASHRKPLLLAKTMYLKRISPRSQEKHQQRLSRTPVQSLIHVVHEVLLLGEGEVEVVVVGRRSLANETCPTVRIFNDACGIVFDSFVCVRVQHYLSDGESFTWCCLWERSRSCCSKEGCWQAKHFQRFI